MVFSFFMVSRFFCKFLPAAIVMHACSRLPFDSLTTVNGAGGFMFSDNNGKEADRQYPQNTVELNVNDFIKLLPFCTNLELLYI